MKFLLFLLTLTLVGCSTTLAPIATTLLRIAVRHAVAAKLESNPGSREAIQALASVLATAKDGASPAALQAQLAKVIAKKAKSPMDAADLADLTRIIVVQYQPIYDEKIAGHLADSDILAVLSSVATAINDVATPTRSLKAAKAPKKKTVVKKPKVQVDVE